MGYPSPIGGKQRIVIPGLAIHSSPFLRAGFWQIGARTTVFELNAPEKPLVVYCPCPWGPEMENLLKISGSSNVKYIVAGDGEHYLGIPSWTEQFPSAKVVAMDVLVNSLKSKGSKVDVVLPESIGDSLISGSRLSELGFDKEFANEFQLLYLPKAANKEIVLYHEPSKTVAEADVFFNLPAYEQYEGSATSYKSGISRFFQGAHPGGWLGDFMSNKFAGGNSKTALEQLLNLPIDRVIPCHGDLMEKNPAQILKKMYGFK